MKSKSSSPDGRENPFVLGFGTKDLEKKQEIASKNSKFQNSSIVKF